MVTASIVRALLDYEPQTGLLRWRESRGRVAAGQIAGSLRKRDGYIRVRVNHRFYGAHRLAWLWIHGRLPDGEIDHSNGVRSDNRIGNLREATASINRQNTRNSHCDSATRLLGVSRVSGRGRNRYRARIWVDSREVVLGVFDDPAEAHSAYLEAKRRHHAGCTI